MLPLRTGDRSLAVEFLACDLDRTLTDARLRPVPSALQRLAHVQSHGVHTILASGRGVEELPQRKKLLARFDGAVLESGSLLLVGGTVDPHPAAHDLLDPVADWLKQRGIPFRARSASVSIAAEHGADLERYPARHDITLSRNRDRIDVTPFGVDKGTGLRRYFKAARRRRGTMCVAVGDGENDLPMFAVADYSVAVGNAVEELKREADEIAPGYGGHALSHFLRRRVLAGEAL